MVTNNIDEFDSENDGLADDKDEEMVGFHETVGESDVDDEEEKDGLDADGEVKEAEKKTAEDDDDDDNAKNDW